MQIPRVDSDPLHNQLIPIDAKLLKLIEKYANKPLLLEKLLVSDKSGIQLETLLNDKKWVFKLPIKGAESLTQLNFDKPQLLLNNINGKILINLATAKQNLSPIPSSILTSVLKGEIPVSSALPGSVQLLFNQAKVDSQGLVTLSNQSKAALNLTTGQSQQTSKVSATNLQSTNPSSANSVAESNSNQIALKQIVNQFLESKPATKQLVSQPLQSLVINSDKFVNSLATPSESKSKLDNIMFNKAATIELANTLLKFLPKNSFGTKLAKLILATENLKSAVQLPNSPGVINDKVRNSGVMLEQKLAQLNVSKQVPQTHGQSSTQMLNQSPQKPSELAPIKPFNNTSDTQMKSQVEHPFVNKDLKSIALQLKQVLKDIKQQIANNPSTALSLNTAIRQLAQNDTFQKILLPPELQLVASSSDPKTSLIHNNELAAQQSKLIFSAKVLQKFPWFNLIYNKSKNEPASRITTALIENQKALIAELARDVNTLLSRIETNQLTSLKNESTSLQNLLVDLPIQNGAKIDSFEVLFESRQVDKKPSNKTWTVTIRFDLEPMGPMFARVSMQNERISTNFYAEQQDTAQLLAANIDVLRDSLLASGVEIDQVNGSRGKVPNELVTDDEHKVNYKV